ncbi:MAG: M10 family metallopeptidase C-terminal domain-containing protein, partial [Hyphomicrobium sp.]
IDLDAGYARGSSIGRDTISGFERVIGSSGADTLTGDSAANVLIGGIGADVLVGGAGIDRLFGESNADRITGGAGRDVLSGGGSADRFIYTATADSGITGATRDRIIDFTAGSDDIDLSALAGAYSFIASAEFTAARQVRFEAFGDDTLVEISTDADTAAEMSILLHGSVALTAGDFIL